MVTQLERDSDELAGTDHDGPQVKRRKLAPAKEEASGPSCYSCRKRKAKCSRDEPCANCSKLGVDCIYDQDRQKPGMRTGAIESLNQRVAALENMFVGQGVLWQQIWKSISKPEAGSGCSPSSQEATIQQQSSAVKHRLAALSSQAQEPWGNNAREAAEDSPASKGSFPSAEHHTHNYDDNHSREHSCLPPEDLVNSLVEIYFGRVHPWIPMLHVVKFRKRLSDPAERVQISTILHAIVSLCIRFSDDARVKDSPSLQSWYSTRCRQAVMLQSMESFSVENVQALIICALDTIGSGRGPSAWSIVGSMARTVEQLRLSTEEDDAQTTSKALMKRMAFLQPPATWSETEERRRVFWNVFLMDRFCSVSTGWNLSLTNADVKRRLPCEGAMWEAGQPIQTQTPYFGVASQSYKQGNDSLPAVREGEDGQTSLGGFAYCIEATESLSLVTSFFLQYEVDFKEVQAVQRWLMRFKQLDLRLVQWKFFLPEKWREACVVNDDGNLDPNLVLAHITHNTAVVLLHQGLAYPSPDWQALPVRLPSSSSAETCQAAAVEVATIAAQFLQASNILTNPQFAFCLFVCGRMLLTHVAYYGGLLPDAFDSIISSLDIMAVRWRGTEPKESSNLASKFASRLMRARTRGIRAVDIREEAFSDKYNAEPFSDGFQGQRLGHVPENGEEIFSHNAMEEECALEDAHIESPESISLAFPPLPISFQLQNFPRVIADANDVISNTADSSGHYLEFCDLSDQTFLPAQRVSMFSQSYQQS